LDPLRCLLGIEQFGQQICSPGGCEIICKTDATQVYGSIISFPWIVGYFAFFLTLFAFIEKDRLRSLIFSKTSAGFWLKVRFFLPIGLWLGGYLLLLIPGTAIPFIGYPAGWELLAMLTVLWFGVSAFRLGFYPEQFLKIRNSRDVGTLRDIANSVFADDERDIHHSFSALTSLLRGQRLDDLVKLASSDGDMGQAAINLIDEVLPDARFVAYLAAREPNVVRDWVASSLRHRIWDHGSGGLNFFMKLSQALLHGDDSVLQHEENEGTVTAPGAVFMTIFTRLELVGHMHLFTLINVLKDEDTLERYSDAVLIGFREYFRHSEFHEGRDNARAELITGIVSLTSEKHLGEFWARTHGKADRSLSVVAEFLEAALSILKDHQPVVGTPEQRLEPDSVCEEIASAIARFLRVLAKAPQDSTALETSMIILKACEHDSGDPTGSAHQTIVARALVLISHQVRTSIQDKELSPLPMLLHAYIDGEAFSTHSLVCDYTVNLFYKQDVGKRAAQEPNFAQLHLPGEQNGWSVRDEKVYRRVDKSETEVYPDDKWIFPYTVDPLI
jgi:hypothetical protein